ncbi:MAG: AtpZ/AtpI family protein [Planctomycetota bacterium]|jgi:F0F1-type ATP synthase assembly protein I
MTSNGDNGAGPSGSGRSPSGQRAIGAGLTLAVSVGVFAYGGIWLDRQFGTKPWLLLLLVLLGIVGGMLHLIREVAPELWPFGKPADRHDQNDASKQAPK